MSSRKIKDFVNRYYEKWFIGDYCWWFGGGYIQGEGERKRGEKGRGEEKEWEKVRQGKRKDLLI